ncbi:XdhC family protein [Microbulbifer spongiae]|uniref:XdhC family protein n=1 Tax=Microbulbifer spongiae TaxID=2944933 RepID=A0ABY9ECS3_9GAMM|nr:XdhC/CoxI family protein [Microbulbifer sp. MI-G]WKD50072.1 XdhC family protein [Microbulbifer sp. MI-G]
MSHHIEDLLSEWQAAPYDDWVLAVITRVQGSAYRKAGAMMLFHPLGKSIGLVSGGCLEADLKRHAQRAIQYDTAIQVIYDAGDETDVSYQLGCGGIVELMLFPLTRENHYLELPLLAEYLNAGKPVFYELVLPTQDTGSSELVAKVVSTAKKHYPKGGFTEATLVTRAPKKGESEHRLVIPCRTRFHLAIFGGGLDAQPVTKMAQQLGWRVTVIDERTSYARQYDFPDAQIIKQKSTQLTDTVLSRFDAAIVMQHNLDLDAKALQVLSLTTIDFVALLGPPHRRDKVLGKAGVTIQDFHGVFSAPAGLALGGELPESIALSILAQCHGVLHQAELTSLDRVMT